VSEAAAEEQMSLDRQKILAIGSLARNVSMDFSNWLSAISGHASSIADNLIPNTRAHEEALHILEVAEQASGLTKRLLSVARATDVKGDGKVEKIALDEIVKDAITLVESAFLKQKIAVKVRPLGNTHYVLAESGLLLDCLMHVFLNAADAIPNGGTIAIDIAEETDSGKPFVALRVHDTGPGMERETMDQIFQPFFTAKKGRGPTSGLGLSIVLSAIHKWGGFIKIRSQSGRGTSLRLFLPAADVPPPKEQRGKAEQVGGETILFADDDAELTATMKTVLKEAGYRVFDATTGEDAVSIYKKYSEKINLSIIDVVMPGKDGKHVLGQILRVDPTAPIVMASGFSRDYVRGYLERGAWAFLQKPYDHAQLLTIIRRVLDQKKTARQKASAG
jgi:CheY-like chemotaxis protein